MDLYPGARVDRYILLEPLGEGGQGAVYKAQDPLDPDQPRAIKLVGLMMSRPNDVERVRREARALARLRHPSLLACHALFEDLQHNVLGIAMDYVDGVSLKQAIGDARLSDRHRLALLRSLAGALAYVHANGVTHRDLKLENVLLKNEFWDEPEAPQNLKLVDFGIAAMAGNPNPLTALDTVIGTLAYLAPELLDPARFAGGSSALTLDTFAFGILTYRLFIGGHPTGLGTDSSIVDYAAAYRRIAESGAEWPLNIAGGAWCQIVRDCLKVDPKQRIQNGKELKERCDAADDTPLRLLVTDPSTPTVAESPGMMYGDTIEMPAFSVPGVASSARAPLDTTGSAPTAARHSALDAPTTRMAPAPSVTGHPSAPPFSQPPTPTHPSRSEPSALEREPVKRLERSLIPWMLAVMALGVFGYVFLVVIGPRDVSPAPLPSATSAVPTQATELEPDDERADAAVDAGSRPMDCKPEQDLCECCPSGRDCRPGACVDTLEATEHWRLRLVSATKDGQDLFSAIPDARVCVKINGPNAKHVCTEAKALADGGVASEYLEVSGRDIDQRGIEVDVMEPRSPVPLAHALVRGVLQREVLCKGLSVQEFVDSDGVESVVFYLDAPNVPPKRCQPK